MKNKSVMYKRCISTTLFYTRERKSWRFAVHRKLAGSEVNYLCASSTIRNHYASMPSLTKLLIASKETRNPPVYPSVRLVSI